MPIDPQAVSRLINLAQEGVPFTERPYAVLAEKAGMMEDQAVQALMEARESGLVREISAIFEAQAIGYLSTLVAMKVSPDLLDEAASVISAHPGVSHNYSREHDYNLWFTLAAPQQIDIGQEIARLAQKSGNWPWHTFPTLKRYKIGVRFDMIEDVSANNLQYIPARPIEVTPAIRLVIRALQTDLPPVTRPFGVIAERFGLTERELIDSAQGLIDKGAIRRYAAVVRHRQAGYRSNYLSVWDIPADRTDEAGQYLAQLACVSHCYERPVYPDWPYRLFAMMHSRSEESVRQAVDAAVRDINPVGFALLKSVKEYKKERVRYFAPDQGE